VPWSEGSSLKLSCWGWGSSKKGFTMTALEGRVREHKRSSFRLDFTTFFRYIRLLIENPWRVAGLFRNSKRFLWQFKSTFQYKGDREGEGERDPHFRGKAKEAKAETLQFPSALITFYREVSGLKIFSFERGERNVLERRVR